jgi:two-component system, OmpR family, sensor kinase
MRVVSPNHGPSLLRQISLRLVAAAVIVSLIEIVGVIFIYSRNHPKLAEQLVTQQAERIFDALARNGDLRAVEPPYGASDWTFNVEPAPSATDHDWTRHAEQGDREVIHGARRLPNGHRVTMSVTGEPLALFAPVFLQEAYHHVIVPVAPVTILVLLLNVYIVRRMLAPLSASAAEVDGLDPSRMDTRLYVPANPREVRALVLAINRALDRLQEAMRTLESFTADAAHEMRTPLSILKLRIDALEPGPTKERLREDVAGMTRLVNQMLDLAQADTLDAQMNQTVHLSTLARDVVERMLPMAVARGCDIELVDWGGESVQGHAEALARVLANLVDNAIAHSPPDCRVDVIVGPGRRLEVRDRGPGFTPETAGHLFRRFWRGPSPGRAGAGLGLAIAQSILSRHGAAITADNANDGGAVFTIQWSSESFT